MSTVATTPRLSPKVRRLLREHDLRADVLTGTGHGGRLTPQDVLDAADGPVLASPLARRLLREAGVALADAARDADARRLRGADVERLLRDDRGGTAAPSATATAAAPAPAAGPRGEPATLEVEAARLLAALAAAHAPAVALDGTTPGVEVAVASAAAGLLARRPELLPGAAGLADPVALVVPTPGGPRAVTVPDARCLTVAGLARRAAAAASEGGAGSSPVLLVVAEGHAAGATHPDGAGVLVVGEPAPRRVTALDEHGHELVRTVPHLPLRLHAGSVDGASTTLRELASTIGAWAHPVCP